MDQASRPAPRMAPLPVDHDPALAETFRRAAPRAAATPLFSEAERVALDFALAAASVPNDVTDEMFRDMRQRGGEGQIVEILAVIAMFGFFNRWNDTMATPP